LFLVELRTGDFNLGKRSRVKLRCRHRSLASQHSVCTDVAEPEGYLSYRRI
jgi:hypothetical protein